MQAHCQHHQELHEKMMPNDICKKLPLIINSSSIELPTQVYHKILLERVTLSEGFDYTMLTQLLRRYLQGA